jgi:hypothetical protein
MLFGSTRYDEYEKYWTSLSTPQTRLKISSFLHFLNVSGMKSGRSQNLLQILSPLDIF